MNVCLTRRLEAWVRQKVGSGRYSSASEVIREALRIMEERDRLTETSLAQASPESRPAWQTRTSLGMKSAQRKRKARAV